MYNTVVIYMCINALQTNKTPKPHPRQTNSHYHEWGGTELIILPSNNDYVFDQLITTAEAKTCFEFKTYVFAYGVGQVWYISCNNGITISRNTKECSLLSS